MLMNEIFERSMHMKKSIRSLWGISEAGFSLMSTMETAFLIFFLTDVAKLPLWITAIITGSSAIIDAIGTVIGGVVIDKVTFKNGKYRPWLLICPPVVTFFFVLCFTKIGGDVSAGLIIGVGYVLSHFVWNIAWTVNRNLISAISTDPADRSFLSARLAVGSSIGKILSSYGVPVLSSAFILSLGGVSAYTVTALILCLCFWAAYYTHYFITKGHDTVKKGAKPATLGAMAKSIVTNPPLIAILLHDALRLLAFYFAASTASYFCKVVIGDASKAKTILMLFYLGCIIGGLFTRKLVNKFGTKKTTFIGMIGWLVFQALCLVLPANLYVIGLSLFIGQIFFGITYGQTANYYTMCGTYSEWKTGENTRGIIMAFCSLAIKLAIAIRGILIPAILAMIGYNGSLTVFPEAMVSGIRTAYALVPCVGILISLIPLALFKLDDKKVIEMEAEITQRKAAKV